MRQNGAMRIESILSAKGRSVETIAPGESTLTATLRLTTRGIGALVVTSDGERLEGIISERDIVRGLARHGTRVLELKVSEVMSRHVPVCAPDDPVKHVMEEMTRTRHRHLPVVQDGKLCGLVSIGDVVKHRLDEIALETGVLRDAYIALH